MPAQSVCCQGESCFSAQLWALRNLVVIVDVVVVVVVVIVVVVVVVVKMSIPVNRGQRRFLAYGSFD